MRATELLTMFDYLAWLRERILAAAAELPTDEFVSAETVTARDLRATLVHIIDVEASWRARLMAGSSDSAAHPPELDPLTYPTVDAVGTHWRRDAADTRRWLSNLTDEQLEADCLVEDRAGYPLWADLLHMALHGIEECEDATVLLRRTGNTPATLGFLDFWDSRLAGASVDGQDAKGTVGLGGRRATGVLAYAHAQT